MEDDPIEIIKKYLYGTWAQQKKWDPRPLIVGAEGPYLIDRDGNRYLDFSSQLVCVNLGYGNNEVIDAIKDQLEKIPYAGPGVALEVRAAAAKELASVVPANLRKFIFSSSGTEANEDAIKIARLYSYPCYKVIARYRSYHGSTATSISMTGDLRRPIVEFHTNVRGTIFAPDPYCYRCPFGEEYPGCGVLCAQYIDYIIEREKNVAAIFMEPVTGTNGVIVPPPEYYEVLREIADKYDIILIFDEVMSGWGRTGEWFAHQNWDVSPDMMTTAKGASSSYVPIGIVATTGEIAEFFEDNFFAVGHTFAYHPLAMAAVTAVIKVMKREGYVSHAKRMGRYLGRRLQELVQTHPSIGDVRGIGLFWAVELVKNRVSKRPFNVDQDKFHGRPLVVAYTLAGYRFIPPFLRVPRFWQLYIFVYPYQSRRTR